MVVRASQSTETGAEGPGGERGEGAGAPGEAGVHSSSDASPLRVPGTRTLALGQQPGAPAGNGGGNGHTGGNGHGVPAGHHPASVGGGRPSARIHWVGSFASFRHPSDLFAEMTAGRTRLVVVDARWPQVFAREHLPGAINMPVRHIDEANTAGLPRDASIVVYCWNESCHASTKAAARFAALGFPVNELHGGLQAWKQQGYPTERG